MIESEIIPVNRLRDLKAEATGIIDKGNRLLNLDLIPRNDDGEAIDAKTAGVVQLYKTHIDSDTRRQDRRRSKTVSRAGRRSKEVPQTSLLYFLHKNAVVHCGESAVHAFYSLYDNIRGEYISESYFVKVTDQLSNMGSMACVFTELSRTDYVTQAQSQSLYLVCYLVRIGGMTLDVPGKASKKTTNTLRRPIGCGVVSISDFLARQEEDYEEDFQMPIFQHRVDENDFSSLHKHIINNMQNQYKRLDLAKGLYFSLRLLSGNLDDVRKEKHMLFRPTTAVARKLGFPDIIRPGDVRNDLFVTIGSAYLEKKVNKIQTYSQPNLEVRMVVCMNNGEVLQNCICVGAGRPAAAEYVSCIIYHASSPQWNETIRLQIPTDKFESTHLKFYFRHVSSTDGKEKNNQAWFTFIPLMDARHPGIPLANEAHTLPVYKYDARYDPKGKGTCTYLKQAGDLHSNEKEQFTIRTLVCSTKLTQNPSLLDLLRWRLKAREPKALEDVLKAMTYVPTPEIVKFLTDIFDALFSILDSHPGLSRFVFDALVHIIDSLDHKNFLNFRPVLDAYIQKHFSGAMAHAALVSCLKEQVADSLQEKSTKAQDLRKALKALEYIFKFIIRSRVVQKRAMGAAGADDSKFKAGLDELFRLINRMMQLKADNMIATQHITLQNFAKIFIDMGEIFTMTELSSIAREFMESLQTTTNSAAKSKNKLEFMLSLVECNVFASHEGRCRLLPTLNDSIKRHLANGVDLQATLDILRSVLTTLFNDRKQSRSTGEVNEVVLPLLKLLIDLTLDSAQRDPGLQRDLLSTVLAMMQLMKPDHYTLIIQSQPKAEQAVLTASIIRVLMRMLAPDVFEREWMTMRMLQSDIIMEATKAVSDVIVSLFLKGADFHFELWDMFFKLSSTFLCQDCLRVEAFSPAKRNKVLKDHGDKRETMASHVNEVWGKLGSNQAQFIPSLVGPFQEMALVPQRTIRADFIPMFFDMIEMEANRSGNFKVVADEIINTLDVFVSRGGGDVEYRDMFDRTMREKCANSAFPVVKAEGPAFIDSVNQLLTRLLNYRDIKSAEHRDMRAHCLFDLMQFYQVIGRETMHVRYIYKLADVHEESRQHAECAFTLRLHADMLAWSDEPLPALSDIGSDGQPRERYPAQTARERKATLYGTIIDKFDRAQCWEEATPLCKELAEQYESALFDYPKLSALLKQQAGFLDKIVAGRRDGIQYYKVSYWGLELPESVRNKEFVYRARKDLPLSLFQDRIQKEFPQANMIGNSKDVDATKRESKRETYCQIHKITPKPPVEPKERFFKGREVDKNLLAYYNENAVKTFEFTRPKWKGPKTENEFENLWTEIVVITTATSLPSQQNRVEIVSRECVEKAPIVTAVETMKDKNEELQGIIGEHGRNPSLNINPLTMALNGVIDAAVMGGTDKYAGRQPGGDA